MQIDIQQPENTTRYWCPIDVPTLLDTEENEIAYAKKFCNWKENSNEDRKVAICKHLRKTISDEYKFLYVESELTKARQQALETINNIL